MKLHLAHVVDASFRAPPLQTRVRSRPGQLRVHLFEFGLVRARWLICALYLLALPYLSVVELTILLALEALLLCGNFVVLQLLKSENQGQDICRASRVAALLDTGGPCVLAVLPVMRGVPLLAMSGLLLPVPLIAYFRYGKTGFSVCSGSTLVAMPLAAILRDAFGVGQSSTSTSLVIAIHVLIIATGALVACAIYRAGEEWRNVFQSERSLEDVTLRRLHSGLTPREWEILGLLARDDLTYDEIGEMLFISPRTVKSHVHNIGEKLGATGRRRIIRAARKQGIIDLYP